MLEIDNNSIFIYYKNVRQHLLHGLLHFLDDTHKLTEEIGGQIWISFPLLCLGSSQIFQRA